MSQTIKDTKLHVFLLLSLMVVFVWSFIGCFDLFTWVLEALPVIIGVAIRTHSPALKLGFNYGDQMAAVAVGRMNLLSQQYGVKPDA